ncbi:PepSY domain-containing protein, partial [bacterium]|nr:PepSY domain-containing protein [bacterium]
MRIFLVSAILAGLVFAFAPYDAGVEQIKIHYPPSSDAPAKFVDSLEIEHSIAAKIDPVGKNLVLLVSRPIETGIVPQSDDDARRCGRSFLENHPEIVGVPSDNFSFESVHRIKNFWAVSFHQTERGFPVWGARVKMAINSRGEVFYFSSSAKVLKSCALDQNIGEQEAVATAIDYIKPAGYTVDRAEKVVCAVPQGEFYQGVLVWWIEIHTKNPAGWWRVFVDAGTGEIIALVNELRTVSGSIQGEYLPHYYDDPTEVGGFQYEYLIIDSESGYTDGDGNFSSLGGTGSSHSFYTTLSGWFCRILDDAYDVAAFSTDFYGDSLNFVWHTPEFHIDQLNLYYHTNWIHSWVKNYLGYDGMDYRMPATCNDTVMSDNAYYDGHGINFAPEGSYLHELSLFAEVIYHEYTHGVTHHMYPPDGLPYDGQSGAIDEALSDYFPCSIFDDPYMAERTFIGSPSEYMRNLHNSNRYPEDYIDEVHHDGQIIAGAWWDIRGELGAGYTDSLIHYSRFLYPATFEDFLYATLSIDDDDGNLENGTPNAGVIYSAYSRHGIGPENMLTISHTPLPWTEDTTNPYPVDVEIITLFGIDTAVVYYRAIHPGGTPDWNIVNLENVGGTAWEGEIPPQPLGTMVQYYIYAVDIIGNSLTEPPAGETSPYVFRVILDDTPPTIEHIPLQNVGVSAWSPRVVAFAQDEFGISSVVLQYQINGTPMPEVNLEYDAALDGWSGEFEDSVRIGDVVRYKIIATDASLEHNTAAYPSDDSWVEFTVQRHYTDDVETGGYDFVHYHLSDGYIDSWHKTSLRTHSGDFAFKCGDTTFSDYSDLIDACLELPEVFISPGDTFSFWQWMDAETSNIYHGYAWDGGIVEISTDGGSHWHQIAPIGGYPFRIRNNPESPFAAETPCFSGRRNWEQVRFVLTDSGYVRLRLRFGTDGAVTREGWYVDDFRVTNYGWASVFESGKWIPERLAVAVSPNPFNDA